MSPSQRPRLHWSQREQQQQQLQHAQQLPSDKAAINDTLDVLEACGNQSGAGFGSWLARDTLTDSTESCGGAVCMAA